MFFSTRRWLHEVIGIGPQRRARCFVDVAPGTRRGARGALLERPLVHRDTAPLPALLPQTEPCARRPGLGAPVPGAQEPGAQEPGLRTEPRGALALKPWPVPKEGGLALVRLRGTSAWQGPCAPGPCACGTGVSCQLEPVTLASATLFEAERLSSAKKVSEARLFPFAPAGSRAPERGNA